MTALPPLVRVALASLFPALLVVAGLLESADLLLALALEAGLLSGVAGLQAAFSSATGVGSPVTLGRGHAWQDELDNRLARLFMAAAAGCLGASAWAATQVTWDWQSAVGVVAVLGYASAGIWRSSWQAGDLLPHGVRGLLWRLAVVAVGFGLCLPLAGAVRDLSAAGWSTSYDGPGGLPTLPAVEALLLSGVLAPAAWPALLLVLWRGANEVGFAAWRLAGRPAGESDLSADVPA